MGEWALVQASEDCKRWGRLGYPPVRVAVNAAPVQLRRRDFASKVIDAAAGLSSDQGWGLLTSIRLPGGGPLGLYEPRHPRATEL